MILPSAHRLIGLLVFAALPVFPFASVSASAAPAPAAASALPSASAAAVKMGPDGPEPAFLKYHEQFLARGKAGPVGLLFLGDSITAGWHDAPQIWEAYYGKYQPANFGIGGDQTQHVIWRIENGELDGLRPRVTVLMLGTNNTWGYTADEIFAADKKIVELIRAKIPETKVLVLGIFPRGPGKDATTGKVTRQSIAYTEKVMAIIKDVNAKLATLDDGKSVRFLDIGHVFLGRDRQVLLTAMPDRLHPNAAGYQLWADAMKPRLDEMMK